MFVSLCFILRFLVLTFISRDHAMLCLFYVTNAAKAIQERVWMQLILRTILTYQSHFIKIHTSVAFVSSCDSNTVVSAQLAIMMCTGCGGNCCAVVHAAPVKPAPPSDLFSFKTGQRLPFSDSFARTVAQLNHGCTNTSTTACTQTEE
jgi:hypothetical protein